jgi:hypothetical protein
MNRDSDTDRLKEDPKLQELLTALRKQTPEQIQRLQEYLEEIASQIPDLPPASPKEGRRFLADRGKISITLDQSLLNLLEDTRKDLKLSRSSMLELCVWEYFGRPSLSFQGEKENGQSDQHEDQGTAEMGGVDRSEGSKIEKATLHHDAE